MKAFLLAAGLGTRLRPLTDEVPKCLVPIAGRPLLAWWLDLLQRHGVTDVLINLHHLPELVEKFVQSYHGPVGIQTVFEPTLLGSAGTLNANRSFVSGERDFLILYADNLTSADLTALIEEHRGAGGPTMTMALFHAEHPSACGIATLDDEGTIVAFDEKPEAPTSDLANAGLFVATPELFEFIRPESYPWDLGTHVLPGLIGRMHGWQTEGYLRDIGTRESLERAEREWSQHSMHNDHH